MNVKKGMQRLALFAGVIGALVGGAASYLQLETVRTQRVLHDNFELLAASSIAQHERTFFPRLFKPIGPPISLTEYSDGDVKLDMSKVPAGATQIARFTDEGTPRPPQHPYEAVGWHLDGSVREAWKYDGTAWKARSIVNSDSIKTIYWTKDYGVESIDTEDGQTLVPTLPPTLRSYLLIVTYPILGFLVPWGLIRATGWVGAGFFENSDYT